MTTNAPCIPSIARRWWARARETSSSPSIRSSSCRACGRTSPCRLRAAGPRGAGSVLVVDDADARRHRVRLRSSATARRARVQIRSTSRPASASSRDDFTRMTNSSPPKRAITSSLAHDPPQSRRDLDQHLVAHVVTEGVVDVLEVVEVDEREDCGFVRRARTLERVGERAAVEQLGQGVGRGLARERVARGRAAPVR